jgi:hypothetical protein
MLFLRSLILCTPFFSIAYLQYDALNSVYVNSDAFMNNYIVEFAFIMCIGFLSTCTLALNSNLASSIKDAFLMHILGLLILVVSLLFYTSELKIDDMVDINYAIFITASIVLGIILFFVGYSKINNSKKNTVNA